jgi:hypothetical protein
VRKYRRTSISGTTLAGKSVLGGRFSMLFDLTFPCYLTTFSGKKCQSGKVICAFFCPADRSSPVPGRNPGEKVRVNWGIPGRSHK